MHYVISTIIVVAVAMPVLGQDVDWTFKSKEAKAALHNYNTTLADLNNKS